MKKQESKSNDWKTVLVEILVQILTLGLYHVEKKVKGERDQPSLADEN